MSKRRLGHGNSHELDEEEDDDMIESTQNDERPSKHQRVVKDSDDEDEKPQLNGNKRLVASAAGSINGKKVIVQDSSSESESESESKSGSESESEDDSDTEAARIRSEAELKKLATEPEAGIIESITLENFMCHRHFSINLGPNVNFISGENGSGKSAVMIALMVALGAKANYTNRGSKITDLIRTEASSSTIRVTLRNKGPEAYQPEKYGPSIIVERRINKNGASGYKLKDHTGKNVISEKYNDLSLILEQFNIQIDNPISLLTQDTSRQFLNSATSTEKYKLFLTATQLDKMTKDYTTTKENIERIKNLLVTKVQLMAELEKKVREYQKEYKELQQLEGLEKKIVSLKDQLAWLYVVQVEKRIRDKEREIDIMEKNSGNEDREIKKCDEDISLFQGNINTINEELNEFMEQINKFEQEKNLNRQQIIGVEREQSNNQLAMDDQKKQITIAKQRRHRQKISLDEIKRKNAQLANNESKKLDIQRREEERSQYEQRKAESERAREDALKETQQLSEDLNAQRISVRSQFNTLSQLKKQQQVYKESMIDMTRAYGDRYGDFLNKLKQNRRQFTREPIGPVGLEIKLKDERWSYAVECAISKVYLKNFLVFSIDDGNKLQRIADSCGIKKIDFVKISDSDRVYSTPEHDAINPSIPTVLRVIESNSHYVINYLIDSKHIESIAIAQNRAEGDKMMFDNSTPQIISRVFTRDGIEIVKTKNGNINTYPPSDKIGEATLLKVNPENAIQSIQKQLLEIQPKYDAQVKIQDEINARKMNAERNVKNYEAEFNQVSRRILSLSNEIKSIEDSLVQQTDDTEDIESSLREMDINIKEMEEKYEQLDQVKKQFEQKKDPFKEKMRESDSQIEVLRSQMKKIEDENRRCSESIRRLMLKKNQISENKNKNANAKQASIQLLEEFRNELKEKTEKAIQVSERVEVPERETQDSLTKKILALSRDLEKQSHGKRSRQEALQLFTENNNKFRDVQVQKINIEKLSGLLETNLNNRYIQWQRFRLSIARRSNQFFNIFLSKKGYTGTLTFDHKEQKLDINVNLDKKSNIPPMAGSRGGGGGGEEEKGGDTKGLSGGERSFSTVSLLLALWENMECPFRAMDEFDVFMDEVNRSISIKLLISKAEENRSKQYIFVTPLALNHLTSNANIRIHKVRPPIRGQATITESSNFVSISNP